MPLDSDVTLADQLLDVQRALVVELYERLALAGFADVSLDATAVFKDIAPEGSSIADIAQRGQLAVDDARRAAAGLAQLGYAEFDGDTVRLTERGWSAVGAGRRALREIEASWSRRVGDERFAVFVSVIDELSAWHRGTPRPS